MPEMDFPYQSYMKKSYCTIFKAYPFKSNNYIMLISIIYAN